VLRRSLAMLAFRKNLSSLALGPINACNANPHTASSSTVSTVYTRIAAQELRHAAPRCDARRIKCSDRSVERLVKPWPKPNPIAEVVGHSCNRYVATSNGRSVIENFPFLISICSPSSSRAFVLNTFLTFHVVVMTPELRPPKLS